MEERLEWLLAGPPWVAYRARRDLLGQGEEEPSVQEARAAMLAHPLLRGLLDELQAWPVAPLTSHKSAGHALHKLAFLADLGLGAGDAPLQSILPRVLEHQSPVGPFELLVHIPSAFGGSDRDEWAWMLCDTPLLLYALQRFGLAEDPRLHAAGKYLLGLVRENGWPCAAAPQVGRFRGPGRKEDPCPYATLVMLKALALCPAWRDTPACRAGAEALLGLWAQSRERHPYMFYMGTDFRKLKAPLIWYDLLHVAEVLTQFPWLRGDPRLAEMVGLVLAQADAQGRFTPTSVWQAWAGWDFGQKKVPSPWLTLLALRLQQRWSAGCA
jgi:hypothetical protein